MYFYFPFFTKFDLNIKRSFPHVDIQKCELRKVIVIVVALRVNAEKQTQNKQRLMSFKRGASKNEKYQQTQTNEAIRSIALCTLASVSQTKILFEQVK